MLNHHRLHCYRLTLELARTVPALLNTWPKGSSDLADQFKRALSSVLLNIAEGNGRMSPKDRRRFFAMARGSASEVGAIIDIAEVYGLIPSETTFKWQDSILQIVRMVSKLP